MATRWTIRHSLMLLWFTDLMNVTEEVTIHRLNVSTLLSSLNSHNVKVAQKPFQTLGHIFAKPKDPVTKEQRTDAIYSIPNTSDRPNVSLVHV